MKWILIAATLLLTGCINIATHLQPIDQSVQATVEGRDCVPIVLGIGIGTNTIERAKISDLHRAPDTILSARVPVSTPVKRVRSIQLVDEQFLVFGFRCVAVTGEP